MSEINNVSMSFAGDPSQWERWGFKAGDQLTFHGDPNSVRRKITNLHGDSFDVEVHRRPSRGFAKHLRAHRAKLRKE